MKGHIPNAQFVKIMSNYKYDFNKTDLWSNPLKISKGVKCHNLLEMSIINSENYKPKSVWA